MASPRLFTIPPSAPFLKTLIEALYVGKLIEGFPASRDPLALAACTLYLPTRRACRLARDVFLDTTKSEAAILPRIVPIGDIDEDEIVFAEMAAAGTLAEQALALPQALDGLERQLLLTQLVLQWTGRIHPDQGAQLVANTPTAALALAGDLARLMDDMTTREVSFDKLDGIVPENFDKYWQLTLDFLKIARRLWPEILRERGAIEPAERRDRLIAAEAERLAAATDGPVIAAGSTGSMPATAKLLSVIAKLPHGAVVLPGLDMHLEQAAWDLIAGGGAEDHRSEPLSGHPQFALAAFLRRVGVSRAAVVELAAPVSHGREFLLSEALRPAAATDMWQTRIADENFAKLRDRALDGIPVIEAANAEEEALAIAIALREAAEKREKTAALITPDRILARRVMAALDRWKVAFDDSGGDALADTEAGTFARLAAETALGGCEPVTLLALLKHPAFRLNASAGAHMSVVSILERAILHGPRPRPGTAGLLHALESFKQSRPDLHRSDPRRGISDAELDAAAALVSKLAAAVAPLENLKAKSVGIGEIVASHAGVVAALSRDEAGKPVSFANEDGAALVNVFDTFAESQAAAGLAVAPADYVEFFRGVAAGRMVRRPGKPGARVRIYGPLEARLQTADRIVLGGLVEGVWPPETRSDPWLSRPMRHELGLDLPERRIGLSAHDFAQALGAREIVLTRAAKLAGAPTVPSRFLQRLAAVTGDRWEQALTRGDEYLFFARSMDAPKEPSQPCKRPAPRPPRAARPTQLSVTEIEHWLRDPYTIYAKHILALAPLDPVDMPPGARDRGTVIHEAIAEFATKFAEELPADPLKELLAIGQGYFARLEDYPEARAFWWPRFQRIAAWFVEWERKRRPHIASLHVETGGKLEISLGERMFHLTTRADRIERCAGGYAIVDFKTGQAPTEKQVRAGLSPQLTLEAAILRGGGFTEVPPGPVAKLGYVELKGGEPAGKDLPIEFKDGDPDSQAQHTLEQFTAVAVRFENPDTPYRSLVNPMWKTRYGDYDHLARVKEWSSTGGADDTGGDE